jgi:mannitol-1-phosphate 5-dehydrogenase
VKKRLLVYGAGAIGRGFMPWVFPPDAYEYWYVESNGQLRQALNDRREFWSFRTANGAYERVLVPVEHCFTPGEEKGEMHIFDAVLTAVGPRNIVALKESLLDTDLPVVCCENDSAVSEMLSSITHNPNVVFAIPDVITSNTAPAHLLQEDPLAIVTEDGICLVDERAAGLGGVCVYVDAAELRKQWLAKLYIHNTPHCIAAYLGSLLRVIYLHESMQDPAAEEIVAGAMAEMEKMLLVRYGLPEAFLNWYAAKEIQRFRNVMLYDPVSRVAREPFRKLAPNERLIGAAELCISSGIVPNRILLGIMAAFCYQNGRDPDSNIQYLTRSLDPADFLKIIIRLRPGEALFELLLQRWEENLVTLGRIGNG